MTDTCLIRKVLTQIGLGPDDGGMRRLVILVMDSVEAVGVLRTVDLEVD